MKQAIGLIVLVGLSGCASQQLVLTCGEESVRVEFEPDDANGKKAYIYRHNDIRLATHHSFDNEGVYQDDRGDTRLVDQGGTWLLKWDDDRLLCQ